MDQKQHEEAREKAEQFESIPWASLVPQKKVGARRLVIVIAILIAGALVGVVSGAALRTDTGRSVTVTLAPKGSAEPTDSQIEEPSLTAPTSPLASSPDVSAPAQEVTESLPAPPRLYSEADLMAVMPEEEMRAAVMRAEWFVTDFFTVDGDVSAVSDVLGALPTGRAALPLPHESGAGLSYVEWARAYLVEPLGPARYRVAVAFRTRTGPAPGELVRSPVRAVTVDIQVGADGATRVADYPAPVEPPPALDVEVAVVPEMEASQDILAGALVVASSVGTEPSILLAGLDADGWRVIVLVGDRSGLRWPLAVRR